MSDLACRTHARCWGYLRSQLAERVRSRAPTLILFDVSAACAQAPHGTIVLGRGATQRDVRLSPLGIHAEVRAGGQWVFVRIPWYAIRNWRPIR